MRGNPIHPSRAGVCYRLCSDTTFISRARVRPQKWLHVALTRSQSSVSLYFNGVLDVVKEVGAGCNNEVCACIFVRTCGCMSVRMHNHSFEPFKISDLRRAPFCVFANRGVCTSVARQSPNAISALIWTKFDTTNALWSLWRCDLFSVLVYI